jgi:predicted TPR repeat methyltransferase
LGLLREQRRDYEGAAACFRSSVEYGDLRAATHANLGKLYFQLGRVADSDDAYGAAVRADSANAHYRLMLRRVSFVRAVLEGSGVDRALDAYSDGQGADGTVSGAAVGDLLEMAIGLLTAYGHVEAARRVARARVARFPASAAAKYIASALESTPGIDRSPHDYIVETFDAFADAFDAKLVDVLGYDVPEKIDALVRRAVRPSRDVCDALDAGCGTGLVGPLVRSLCRSLTGVDLSPRMLEHAAKRGAYDTLVCEDLVAFLNRSPAAFDLAVAADVLIYFGDLAPVLGAFATALRPGGLLAISFEVHDGAGYKLSPSGRFAHATQFVTELAAGAFTAEATERTTIRLEGAARVPGRLLLLRRS